MKTSINILERELQALCLAHDMVNDFGWGTVFEVSNGKTSQYPLVACFSNSQPFRDNQTVYNLEISVVDKVYNDLSNQTVVESRTLDICRGIFQIMNKSRKWKSMGRVENCVCNFVPRTQDGTSGHRMTLTFIARDFQGVCNVPLTGYDTQSSYL